MADLSAAQETRVGSLCTGYGGIELGLGLASVEFELAWVADPDPAAAAVLAHHHPGVPNLGDITTVDWAAVDPVDLLTAGFPCTDVSAAGRRAGIASGTRSGLWLEIVCAIAVLRPPLILIENVRGLLSARAHSDVEPCPWCLGDRGGPDQEPVLRALGAVLGDLSDLGYDAEWITVAASDIGAAHRRERVFIHAYPADSKGDPRRVGNRDGRTPADASRVGHGHTGPAGVGGVPAAAFAGGAAALLPTPRTSDTNGTGRHGTGGVDLRTAVSLLPTPTAERYGSNQSPSPGAKVRPGLDSIGQLLPTPTAVHHARNATATRTAPKSTTCTTSWTLADVAHADRWGCYADAIARWEQVIGRPAPEPTEPGAKGGARLAPRFVEWLMGLPAGHVTGVPGLSRNDMLRLLGNGVVPQQCAAAWHQLLAAVGVMS